MARKSPRPLWLRILGGLVYSTLLVAVLAGAAVAGWVGQSKVASAVARQMVAQTTPQQVFNGKRAFTLLILGCDEDRYYGGKQILKTNARSDMMLVVRLDFERKRITGLSIPRDLIVRLPGYRSHKINAYHVLGGAELSQRAVEYVLGVPIDRTTELNYKAFQEMVDLVGGVEMYIPKALKYTDRRGGLFVDLKPGRQVLDGYEAMGFVRIRHSDSDFARQQRQKDFMLGFKDAMMAKPGLITLVADKARDVMGDKLSAEEVAALVLFARKVGNDNVKMGQLPVVEAGGYNLALDEAKLPDTLREYNLVPAELTGYRTSGGSY